LSTIYLNADKILERSAPLSGSAVKAGTRELLLLPSARLARASATVLCRLSTRRYHSRATRPDQRSRRRQSVPRGRDAPQVRTGPASDDPHDVMFFRRHREGDPGEAAWQGVSPFLPGQGARHDGGGEVAAAPPKRFAGGGYQAAAASASCRAGCGRRPGGGLARWDRRCGPGRSGHIGQFFAYAGTGGMSCSASGHARRAAGPVRR
jgi:hypothetical protein